MERRCRVEGERWEQGVLWVGAREGGARRRVGSRVERHGGVEVDGGEGAEGR